VHTAVAQGFLQGCVVGKYLVIRDTGWWSRIDGEAVRDTVRGREIGRNEKRMEDGEGGRASSFLTTSHVQRSLELSDLLGQI